MTATETKPADAWKTWSVRLAEKAMALEVIRTDRCGRYYKDRETGETKSAWSPSKGPENGHVCRKLFEQHFKASRPEHVIGTTILSPGDSLGRKLVIDLDNHDNLPAVAEVNEAYAKLLSDCLTLAGLHPFLTTWGGGSFHLTEYFSELVPGAILKQFGEWIVRDWKEHGLTEQPEVFPKQEKVPALGYGNWVRCFGKHHTTDEWAKVWDGRAWLESGYACRAYVELVPDSPNLIPAAEKSPPPPPHETNGKPGGNRFTYTTTGGNGPDVFAPYNRERTLAEVVGWLEGLGHRVVKQAADRVGLCRKDKDGTGESMNVSLQDGVPVLFNFSANAGLPVNVAMSPAMVRAFIDFGACDSAAMAKFAAKLRKDVGSTPDAILADYFRDRYLPVYRDGLRAFCKDRGWVTLQDVLNSPTPEALKRLEAADGCPRDKKTNQVTANAMPRFYSTWAKTAWVAVVDGLPEEAEAESTELAAETFRSAVRAAMLADVTLGKVYARGGVDETRQERRTVIDWCWHTADARCGVWQPVRFLQCWARAVKLSASELKLYVALRPELFGQLPRAERRLAAMPFRTFADLAAKYGVGESIRTNRPCGFSAVTLADDFIEGLLARPPVPVEDAEPEPSTVGPSNGDAEQTADRKTTVQEEADQCPF